MIKLSKNARLVLERFLAKNKHGKTIETPEQMFKRVAKNIASVEKRYRGDVKKSEKEFKYALLMILPQALPLVI